MRLIDADALKAKYEQMLPEIGDGYHKETLQDVLFEIEYAPTISPDEVRGKGKWIRISGFHLDHEYHPARYQCDQCKHFVDSGDDKNYCPNCGAKMEPPKEEG